MSDNGHIIEEIFKSSNEKFARHLAQSDNHRIIVSGRFGIGKTTFLNKFFSEESQQSNDAGVEYKVIHLYPINYQVGENSDVFEYMKRDILARLVMEDGVEIDHERVSFSVALSFLLLNNFDDLISPIGSMIGSIALLKGENDIAAVSKMLSAATEKISSLKKSVTEKYEEKLSSEFNKVKKYIEHSKLKRGSIYENDFYTNLIRILIQAWTEYGMVDKPEKQSEAVSEAIDESEKRKRKESVLIIDDLDRIDPHHTFRLFNIFSAHVDQYRHEETVNKFGFDKVVFVCDIDNIRNLFAHFYGGSESFSGYIDKFYSKEPFYYNPIPEIIENIDKFPSTEFRYRKHEHSVEEGYRDIEVGYTASYKAVFKELLSFVIKANGFTPRNLLKVKGDKILMSGSMKFYWDERPISEASFFICFVARYLLRYAGTPEEVIQMLKRCKKLADADWSSITKELRSIIIAHSVAYLELNLQTEAIASDKNASHKYTGPDEVIIAYDWAKLSHDDAFVNVHIKNAESSKTGDEIDVEKINPFSFLILACEKLYSSVI